MSVHKILGSAIVSAAICAAGASTVVWINNPAKATTATGNSNHFTPSTIFCFPGTPWCWPR